MTAQTRASETITIRLTRGQKRLLERIASATGTTATDVLRRHIRVRSRELGLCEAENVVTTVEEPARDGAGAPAGAPEPLGVIATPSTAPPPATFGDLSERYRAAFVDRGEGTRRELEETIAFLEESVDPSGNPVLSRDLPLAELTPARLTASREAVGASGLRLSRKNLYLTYLRMMLNFALKRKELPADVNPGDELRAFSAVEAGESWVPPPSDVR